MKQVKQFQEWAARVKANTDIVICGDPIRTRKLGKVIADMKLPARVIGCNVENSEDAFLYTHRDAHPCKWAIDHSDTVITIGDGSVVSKAKKHAFETNRSCYNYGRLLSQSLCKGKHYEKTVIMRADIVTLNEAKAEVVVAKPAVKKAADPMVAANKELEVAKREFEAAKAKLDAAQAKVDALAKPVEEKKEEVVEGRGKELFVDVELSSNMGDITKSFTEEQKKVEEEAVDEAVEAFMAKEETKLAEPVKADFTFEGKGYNVVAKEAFDVELFNSCDAETQKAIIEDSMAAGHIVAA
jgi:hypothetical protein